MQDFFQFFWDALVENRIRLIFIFIFTLITANIIIPVIEKTFLLITLWLTDVFDKNISLFHNSNWSKFSRHKISRHRRSNSPFSSDDILKNWKHWINNNEKHLFESVKTTELSIELSSYKYANRLLLLMIFISYLSNSDMRYDTHIISKYRNFKKRRDFRYKFNGDKIKWYSLRVSQKFLIVFVKRIQNRCKLNKILVFGFYICVLLVYHFEKIPIAFFGFYRHTKFDFLSASLKYDDMVISNEWKYYNDILSKSLKWNCQRQLYDYEVYANIDNVESEWIDFLTEVDMFGRPLDYDKWNAIMEELNPSIIWIPHEHEIEILKELGYEHKIQKLETQHFKDTDASKTSNLSSYIILDSYSNVNKLRCGFNHDSYRIEFSFTYVLYNKENSKMLFDFYKSVQHKIKHLDLNPVGSDFYHHTEDLFFYYDLESTLMWIRRHLENEFESFIINSNGYFIVRNNFDFSIRVIEFFKFYIRPILFVMSFLVFFILESLYLELVSYFINQYYTPIVTILNLVL